MALARGLSNERHHLEIFAPVGVIIDGIIVERPSGPHPLILAGVILALLIVSRAVTSSSSS